MRISPLFFSLFLISFSVFSQVGIGTTSPNEDAILDVTATDKALLLPRIDRVGPSSTEPNIANPVDGMLIYYNDEKCFKGYTDGAWVDVTTCTPIRAGWSLTSVNSYNGPSPINSTGIGYNGEAVPTSSTITLNVNVVSAGDYSISATDITTGLIYSGNGTFNTTGAQTINIVNNNIVIPATFYGTINMTLSGDATNTLAIAPRIDIKSITAAETAIVDISIDTDNDDGDSDPTTCGGNGCEQVWMDRNLGARRVAISLDDGLAYGNLYQWGRNSDGHEIIIKDGLNSGTNSVLQSNTTFAPSATSIPPNSDFILRPAFPGDWLISSDGTLWASESSTNNPCPAGYRLPSRTEFVAYLNAFTVDTIDNISDAFTSPLVLPVTGSVFSDGSVSNEASSASYWTATAVSSFSYGITFTGSSVITSTATARSNGSCVRCIKD